MGIFSYNLLEYSLVSKIATNRSESPLIIIDTSFDFVLLNQIITTIEQKKYRKQIFLNVCQNKISSIDFKCKKNKVTVHNSCHGKPSKQTKYCKTYHTIVYSN